VSHDDKTARPHLSVGHSRDEHGTVVAVVGEIDISTVELLNRELAVAADADAGPLIVDLGGVVFMDSTGLRTLVEAADGAERRSQGFALYRVPMAVGRVLQVTKLDARFHEVPDLEPATLAAIRTSGT
jgi:anti-anti-sigma factor